MKKFGNFLKSLNLVGKLIILAIGAFVVWGSIWTYGYFNPPTVKEVKILTKASSLASTPLSYDKDAHAPLRNTPEFNVPANVSSPEMRGLPFGWNAFTGVNYMVGGSSTSVGSIAEELKLNVSLSVNNSTTEQINQLYAFAQGLHNGDPNPTTGVHFICLMADSWPNYGTNLNNKLIKEFGPEYKAVIIDFCGASFGEDKWMLKPKRTKDPRGSLTITVPKDGDYNLIRIKCDLIGCQLNYQLGTYDPDKVNIVAAANDDYTEAGKAYNSGQKYTLHIVKDGKFTGRDTTMTADGVSSWFPVDQQIVQGKGGLVTFASTKDYAAQMGCAIIMIKKWADENRPLVESLITGIGMAGEQIKSHEEALQFGCKVNEIVFADKEKKAEDWYNGFKSFSLEDDNGNEVQIGGSRVFSLADAAAYTGISGGNDKYKIVYNTFSNVYKEAFPEDFPSILSYEDAVDWSFLKAAYNKAKSENKAGSVSKIDVSSATKGQLIGDAAYSIEFNTGSSEISSNSEKTLLKILGNLTTVNNAFVEIVGHTDNTGNPDKNQILSEERANAVKKYLLQKNEDLEKTTSTKGMGQSSPLNPNENQNDKFVQARNRRVEIKVYRAKEN